MILAIGLIIWEIMGILSMGYMCWSAQTVSPDNCYIWWKMDFFLSLFLGMIAGPIGGLVFYYVDRADNNHEEIGFMYWPPRYHKRIRLIRAFERL